MNTTMALSALVVEFQLDRTPPDYQPGDRLSVIVAAPELLAKALNVELSVVWHTSGKGEEDLVVHDFRRLGAADLADQPPSLESTLPASPLSYAGHTVKVCWAVRARVFLPGGRQIVREAPFRLGTVQPAEGADADSPADAHNRPRNEANQRGPHRPEAT